MVGGWKKEDFIKGFMLAVRRLPASYRLFARLPVCPCCTKMTQSRAWCGQLISVHLAALLFMGRDWARRPCMPICSFANAKSIQTHVRRACLFRAGDFHFTPVGGYDSL